MRGAGHRHRQPVRDPPPGRRPVQRAQQEPGRGRDGAGHQGVGAGLLRVPGDQWHGREEQSGAGARDPAAEQPRGGQRGERGRARHGQDRGQPQGRHRVAEHRDPAVQQDVVGAVAGVDVLQHPQQLTERADGGRPGRHLVPPQGGGPQPVAADDQHRQRRNQPGRRSGHPCRPADGSLVPPLARHHLPPPPLSTGRTAPGPRAVESRPPRLTGAPAAGGATPGTADPPSAPPPGAVPAQPSPPIR